MESLSAASVTRSATLPSASRSRRSRIMRLVTLSPSVPASGELLTMNDIETVGGSIGCASSGVSTEGSQKVSATVPLVRPAMATMSPASASSSGVRSRPRKARILVMRPLSISLPSPLSTLTAWFGLTEPEVMRPVMMRPR